MNQDRCSFIALELVQRSMCHGFGAGQQPQPMQLYTALHLVIINSEDTAL